MEAEFLWPSTGREALRISQMTSRPYIFWFPISLVLKKYNRDLNAGMYVGCP